MQTNPYDLKAMKAKVEQIEKLTLELRESGAGIPAIEKNTRTILSITRILKFGVSDPAEVA